MRELTINSRSDIIVPNVIDMTGPISGDTNIAAVIFGALFSIKPNAASELQLKLMGDRQKQMENSGAKQS